MNNLKERIITRWFSNTMREGNTASSTCPRLAAVGIGKTRKPKISATLGWFIHLAWTRCEYSKMKSEDVYFHRLRNARPFWNIRQNLCLAKCGIHFMFARFSMDLELNSSNFELLVDFYTKIAYATMKYFNRGYYCFKHSRIFSTP